MGISFKSRTIIGKAQVKPLKYLHIPKAASSWNDAFVDDPLICYLDGSNEEFKPSFISQIIKHIVLRLSLIVWIRTKISLTVNAGSSLAIVSPPKNGSHPKPGDKLADRLVILMITNGGWLRSKEMRKAGFLFTDFPLDPISDLLGERVNDMFTLELLATEPASQGQGHGGALVDATATTADLNSQAAWLVSSNIDNTAFYESHGFLAVGEIVVGDQNPTWRKPPVVVKIMVREFEKYTNEKV